MRDLPSKLVSGQILIKNKVSSVQSTFYSTIILQINPPLFFIGGVRSVGWDKSLMLYIHLYNAIECIHYPKNPVLCLLISPMATTALFYCLCSCAFCRISYSWNQSRSVQPLQMGFSHLGIGILAAFIALRGLLAHFF